MVLIVFFAGLLFFFVGLCGCCSWFIGRRGFSRCCACVAYGSNIVRVTWFLWFNRVRVTWFLEQQGTGYMVLGSTWYEYMVVGCFVVIRG